MKFSIIWIVLLFVTFSGCSETAVKKQGDKPEEQERRTIIHRAGRFGL